MRPTGDRAEVLEQVLADEDQRQRDDGEIETLEAEGCRTNERAGQRGDDARRGQPDQEGQTQPRRIMWAQWRIAAEPGSGVGANRHEERDTQRDLPGISRQDVEAERRNRRDHREIEHRQQPIIASQEDDAQDNQAAEDQDAIPGRTEEARRRRDVGASIDRCGCAHMRSTFRVPKSP